MSRNYESLIAQEADHWGNVRPDPENPQIWDDPGLYSIFFEREHRYLISRVIASGPKILELGCGEGNLAIELAEHGLDVTAIDLSPERIKRAMEKTKALRYKPEFQVADLNVHVLPESAFDCIVANGSLHHIPAIDRLLEEVERALKPGGKFIVFDFVGMGRIRKLLAAILYAILPTYKPYEAKWSLKSRFRSFLASENQKRKALEGGDGTALHPDSPFEEITGKSLVSRIQQRFMIVKMLTFLPFWYYLAAKIRFPGSLKYRFAIAFRTFDDFLVRARLTKGAYVFIEAERIH